MIVEADQENVAQQWAATYQDQVQAAYAELMQHATDAQAFTLHWAARRGGDLEAAFRLMLDWSACENLSEAGVAYSHWWSGTVRRSFADGQDACKAVQEIADVGQRAATALLATAVESMQPPA